MAKAVLGTVRIAEDGSANFTAPAGKVLYFHLLDENFNELQRMRSVVQLQPGEQRSCVGCHDDRCAAPLRHGGLALNQPVQPLTPPPWGAEPFDYERVVQPVLNANCVRCHDTQSEAKLDLRGTRDARPRARFLPLADHGGMGALLRLALRLAAFQGGTALVRHAAEPPVHGAGPETAQDRCP